MLFFRGYAGAERSLAALQPGTSTDSDDDNHWADAQEGPHSPNVPTSAVCLSSEPFHGLLRAVHNAKRCMDKLHNHDQQEALKHLVLSSYNSTMALGCLKQSGPKLIKAIMAVDAAPGRAWDAQQRLALEFPRAMAWASHAILCAYKEADPDFEMLFALEPSQITFVMCERASRSPGSHENGILWVAACGRFKVLWNLYTNPEYEVMEQQAHATWCHRALRQAQNPADFNWTTTKLRESTEDRLRQAVLSMLKYRPHHPATLQAVRQWYQRVQHQDLIKSLPGPHLAPLCDQNYRPIRPHPDDMRIGFEAALEEFQDPAVAMQHLLVCMYGKLVDLVQDDLSSQLMGPANFHSHLMQLGQLASITTNSSMMSRFVAGISSSRNKLCCCIVDLDDTAPLDLALKLLWAKLVLSLQSCNGKPGPQLLTDLICAANWVVDLHELLTHARFSSTCETLWEIVAERLVAAMLLLARSFDLKRILGEHALLPLMVAEKKRMAELISKIPATQDADSDGASSSSDRSDSEDHHHCTQCNKRKRESEMHMCYKCRRVIYCSMECMRKHAGQHKQDCMRMQLKNRKAARR